MTEYVKAGAGESVFETVGDSLLTDTGANVAISPRVGSGADEFTSAETGRATSPYAASGLSASETVETGTATASLSGGAYKEWNPKTGAGVSARSAAGSYQLPVPPWFQNSHISFNVARGRIAEFVNRVNANDPANSALVVVVLARLSLLSDEYLRDAATLADILNGSCNEATNTGYARKVLDDTAGITATVDDTLDTVTLDFPDQNWSSVGASGGAWGALLVCYDADTTSGTDTNIIPLTKHAFEITPDGRTIYATLDYGGFARC